MSLATAGNEFRPLRSLTNDRDAWFTELSDDGRWTAMTGKHFKEVVVVRNSDGAEVFKKHLGVESASWADFDPAGLRLVYSARDRVVVMDTQTWTEVATIPNPGTGYARPRFSPDGGYLVIADANSIRLLRADLSPVARFRNPMRESHASTGAEGAPPVEFSPDGRFLVEGTRSGNVYAWDLHAIRTRLADLDLDWQDPPPKTPPLTRVDVLEHRCRFHATPGADAARVQVGERDWVRGVIDAWSAYRRQLSGAGIAREEG